MILSDISHYVDAIKSERLKQGLSQSQAAELAGVSRKWLSDLENHRSDPPASLLIKMLNALNIPVTLDDDGPIDNDEIDLDTGFMFK